MREVQLDFAWQCAKLFLPQDEENLPLRLYNHFLQHKVWNHNKVHQLTPCSMYNMSGNFGFGDWFLFYFKRQFLVCSCFMFRFISLRRIGLYLLFKLIFNCKYSQVSTSHATFFCNSLEIDLHFSVFAMSGSSFSFKTFVFIWSFGFNFELGHISLFSGWSFD